MARRKREVSGSFKLIALKKSFRYESAIVTLHAKVASLKSSLEVEQSNSKRQKELIERMEKDSQHRYVFRREKELLADIYC